MAKVAKKVRRYPVKKIMEDYVIFLDERTRLIDDRGKMLSRHRAKFSLHGCARAVHLLQRCIKTL